MSLTKVTSGAVSGLAASATTDTTDASNITTGTIPTARLASTLDLSGKTVTLPAASVTAHATNPTKASIEALGIAASSITGALPAISGANLTGLVSSLASMSDVTVSTISPTPSSNKALGHLWFNTTTGEGFICTRNAVNNNIWTNTGKGINDIRIPLVYYKTGVITQNGTFTIPAGVSTVWVTAVGSGGGGGGGSHFSFTDRGGNGGSGGRGTARWTTTEGEVLSWSLGSGGGGGIAGTDGGAVNNGSSGSGTTTVSLGSATILSLGAGSGGGGGISNRWTGASGTASITGEDTSLTVQEQTTILSELPATGGSGAVFMTNGSGGGSGGIQYAYWA